MPKMSTTKDTTKETSDTYVRSSTDTDKNKSAADKSHDTSDTTYTSNMNKSGTSTQQQSSRQFGSQSHEEQGGSWKPSGVTGQQQQTGGSYGGHSQQEVQQKLKEVGHLLQKAGQLLQDLQVGNGGPTGMSPGGQYGGESGWISGRGGNYGGPFGQSEQYSSSQQHPHWDQQGQRWQTSGMGASGYGQQSYGGRWEDREERPFSAGQRGGFPGGHQERCGHGPDFRGPCDRFGGFGGPNRPDMAYGSQYGQHDQPRGGRQEWSSRGGDFSGRTDRY